MTNLRTSLTKLLELLLPLTWLWELFIVEQVVGLRFQHKLWYLLIAFNFGFGQFWRIQDIFELRNTCR